MAISGAHIVIYTADPEADRKFFRDVLKFPYVDAGEGWLIFALPPSEAAFHPVKSPKDQQHGLFLMCDNLEAILKSLRSRGVKCRVIGNERWGRVAMMTLPSGGELGLYEPKHPLARSR